MKFLKSVAAVTAVVLLLTACSTAPSEPDVPDVPREAVSIALSDGEILVNGTAAESTAKNGVHIANDIVYYETGHDFTYGEGAEEDAHTPEEAAAHTVVHISQPGTYALSGTLSKGQIAVDLGEDAAEDPEAVVTLILDNAHITCEVAPAVIFYNVYECGDTETPSRDVDTSAAGANIILADGSENTVRGSYVARIYKPGSVVLSEDGSEVTDSKKLHKYDAAFYSKMSMNVGGNGALTIDAENEGLDSELHLTLNGGKININSGNDGINTNEDGVSVITVNGGELTIRVTGETGEGDGIDSNGWLVINGGTVIAEACSHSADAGIDSDMGIHIYGGTVIATGNMLDRIEDGGQNYAVFSFAERQTAGEAIRLNAENATVMRCEPNNDYSVLIYSSPELTERTYTLWQGETQLSVAQGGMMGRPEMPEGMEPPEGFEPPEGMEQPEGMEAPEGFEPPEGMEPPFDGQEPPQMEELPADGERPQMSGKPHMGNDIPEQEAVTEFSIKAGGNMFRVMEE